jgi:hypothetical protein
VRLHRRLAAPSRLTITTRGLPFATYVAQADVEHLLVKTRRLIAP